MPNIYYFVLLNPRRRSSVLNAWNAVWDIRHAILISSMYSVSQEKGYPLKSSASVERSNLNVLTP